MKLVLEEGLPPSALSGISPARGEIGWREQSRPTSPLVGEDTKSRAWPQAKPLILLVRGSGMGGRFAAIPPLLEFLALG